MASVTVLKLDTPGRSFAYWLALNVPDLFLYQFKRAQRATLATKVATGLGQDDSGDDESDEGEDDTGTDDSDIQVASDAGSNVLEASETPQELLNIPDGIEDVDTTQLNSDLVALNSEAMNDVTQSLAASSDTTPTSSAAANMVATVGNSLTAPSLTVLSNAALAYFQASNNAALADVFTAQLANAAAGNQALPLTTVTDAAGQSTPALVTAGGAQPLTAAQVQALTPSGLTIFLAQYGVWLGVGAALLLLFAFMGRRQGS
jgi:hypothetical protein